MKMLLSQIFMIAAAAFFAGLIIYCYYIVLTSKDENYKPDEEASDRQTPVRTATDNKRVAAEDMAKKQKAIKSPSKHSRNPKKVTRRAA